MDATLVGIICLALLFLFISLTVPIGLSFLLSGLISATLLIGFDKAISLLMGTAYNSIASPSMLAIPLFVLLGSLAAQAGLAARAYESAEGFTRGLPGALGVATCWSCALFGAVSGASLAAAAIFGRIAFPEMQKQGYDNSFALGTIASAGTFASMIPPSMMLIIYAMFSNVSIGRLFLAGIVPGLFTAAVYSVSIIYRVKYNKRLVLKEATVKGTSLKQRSLYAINAWPIMIVGIVILGGIFTGTTTPTESAAVASIIVLIYGIINGYFKKLSSITGPLRESANTTSMLFLLIVGAIYFSRVMAISRIPYDITSFVTALDTSPTLILFLIFAFYFILGLFMLPLGIYALTMPILLPVLIELGYDLIWFGIVTMKLVEIAAVTPPVGLNVYALKGVISKEIPVMDIFAGVLPFIICDLIVLVVLFFFPQIVLWLPNTML